jgi:TonB family protein
MRVLLASALLSSVLALGAVAPAAAATCAQPNKPASLAEKPITYSPTVKSGAGSGTVMIKMDISADGKVTGHEFMEHSGTQALDIAALRTANQVQYTPEMMNCKPVAGSYLFVMVFPAEPAH